MALLHDSAMRVSELVGTRWEHIEWGRRRIRFWRPKLRSMHEVTLTASLPVLDAYRRASGAIHPTGLIFPGRKGGPLTTRAVQLLMVRLCEDAGVPRFKARVHIWRHTRATELIEDGCPIAAVQAHLGHANAATTSGFYAHLADGWVAEQIRLSSR